MVRGSAVAVAGVMLVTILMLPMGLATCPEKPRDCGSVVDLVEVDVGGSSLSLGAYEDDAVMEQRSDDGLLSAGEPARPLAHANGTRGELNSGDSGGVLIVVDDPGGASEFTVTFDADAAGVQWTGESFIVISGAEANDHFVLPFTVTSTGKDLRLDFTVQDDRGNEADGTLKAPIDGKDGLAWWVYVLIVAVILLVYAMFRRGGSTEDAPEAPEDPTPPEPPGTTEPMEPSPPVVTPTEPVVDVGDSEDGSDEEDEEEEPLTVPAQ